MVIDQRWVSVIGNLTINYQLQLPQTSRCRTITFWWVLIRAGRALGPHTWPASLIQLITMVNKMIIKWRLAKLITSTSCKEGKVQILTWERPGLINLVYHYVVLFVPLRLISSDIRRKHSRTSKRCPPETEITRGWGWGGKKLKYLHSLDGDNGLDLSGRLLNLLWSNKTPFCEVSWHLPGSFSYQCVDRKLFQPHFNEHLPINPNKKREMSVTGSERQTSEGRSERHVECLGLWRRGLVSSLAAQL